MIHSTNNNNNNNNNNNKRMKGCLQILKAPELKPSL